MLCTKKGTPVYPELARDTLRLYTGCHHTLKTGIIGTHHLGLAIAKTVCLEAISKEEIDCRGCTSSW